MAASLVFRPLLCACHKVSQQSHPKYAFKTLTRLISFSSLNNKELCTSQDGSHSIVDDHPEPSKEKRSEGEGALRKFVEVVEKVKADKMLTDEAVTNAEENSVETFATMLRKSKLIAMGETKDQRVLGRIIEVMEDDLYIDFGGKFFCVCPRPKRNQEKYQRGSEVIIYLNSMEMSSAFLGSDIHISLLEADATLLGLFTSKSKTSQFVFHYSPSLV